MQFCTCMHERKCTWTKMNCCRYLLRRLLQHQAVDSSRQHQVPVTQTYLPFQMSSQVPVSQAPAPRQSTQSIAQLLGEVEKRRKKTNRKKKPPTEENAAKGSTLCQDSCSPLFIRSLRDCDMHYKAQKLTVFS